MCKWLLSDQAKAALVMICSNKITVSDVIGVIETADIVHDESAQMTTIMLHLSMYPTV